MAYCWLVITVSWIGSASLQYINTGDQNQNIMSDSYERNLEYSPAAYHLMSTLNDRDGFLGHTTDFENKELALSNEDLSILPTSENDMPRAPRNIEENSPEANKLPKYTWMSSQNDLAQSMYVQKDKDNVAPTTLQDITPETLVNEPVDVNNENDKRSFSPWKGKRQVPKIDQSNMWTWKRATNIREPTMPKRVRFSPWGGKRSNQLTYKPGSSKVSKIVFLNAYPDLARIVSSYKQLGLGTVRSKMSRIHMAPTISLFHPLRILAVRSDLGPASKDLNLKKFIESSKIFKTGHPYTEVNLNKLSKRKAKFNAWGGKRLPPIIGPIWSPANETIKDTSLNAIILIRDGTEGIAKSDVSM